MIDASAFTEPAACADLPPDMWFPEPGDHGRAAKWICKNRCLARDECLTWALATRQGFGIWAGLSTAEREKLQRGGRTIPPPRTTPTAPRRPLTTEQRQQVLDLSGAGLSTFEVAAQVGITTRSVTRIRSGNR